MDTSFVSSSISNLLAAPLAIDAEVNQKIWDFLLSGGVFMAFIGACSFIALTVAIHRFISLRRRSVIPDKLLDHVEVAERYIFHGSTGELREKMAESDTPLGRIGRVALSPEHQSREEASAAVEVTAREEVVKLQTGLAALEVVITIAPMLGLLGTVTGLVGVFAELGAETEVTDPTAIAAGIAMALNTTIAGLVVAVLTVIVHSYLNKRIEAMAARLEVVFGNLVNTYFRHRDRAETPEDEDHASVPAPETAPEEQDLAESPPASAARRITGDAVG